MWGYYETMANLPALTKDLISGWDGQDLPSEEGEQATVDNGSATQGLLPSWTNSPSLGSLAPWAGAVSPAAGFTSVWGHQGLRVSKVSGKWVASLRTVEWYISHVRLGEDLLQHCVEIDPERRGVVPVLKGTGFTVSQTLAELAKSSGVNQVAVKFELEVDTIKGMLFGLSGLLKRPFQQ